MSPAFIVCAAVTTVSALVSLGFSIAAVRQEVGGARTMALYACVRSVALIIVSAVALLSGFTAWLLAIAWVMIIVQAGDALIGITIKDRVKTFGPAGTALLNLAAVIWLFRAVG